jgi:DNA-directed RNA polymerase subunit alpha
MLSKPIGDLNLSVRARTCMSKLNIQTIGDLMKHTGDELLECKNFGITSLNEVRDKLTGMGLKLKND